MQIECIGERFTVRALYDPDFQRIFLSKKIRSPLQLFFTKELILKSFVVVVTGSRE